MICWCPILLLLLTSLYPFRPKDLGALGGGEIEISARNRSTCVCVSNCCY